jgi:poly(A) polymerase
MRAWATGGDPDGARRLLALARGWARPSMPVGGRDLARLGLKPGPETGRVLKAFEGGWVADDFPDHGHEDRLRALLPPA